jgi:hypothetical protein
MTIVLQAYRCALDPTLAQEAVLRSHCGAQRYAFNWGLALIKANLDQRRAEKSYDTPDTELTPSVSWSAYGLRKLWNQAKESSPSCGAIRNEPDKPMSDPHHAGSGYRHGKTLEVNAAPRGDGSRHGLTRFVNGQSRRRRPSPSVPPLTSSRMPSISVQMPKPPQVSSWATAMP